MHTLLLLCRFEDYFVSRVKQLIYTFPEDAATSTGAPFWSAPKRFPHPLRFSACDPGHLHFVMAASILRAESFGIPIPEWSKSPKKLAGAVDCVMVPEFQPKKDAKIVTDEKATSLSAASVDDAAVINELIKKLELCRNSLSPGFRMKPIQFEKVCLILSIAQLHFLSTAAAPVGVCGIWKSFFKFHVSSCSDHLFPYIFFLPKKHFSRIVCQIAIIHVLLYFDWLYETNYLPLPTSLEAEIFD